MNQHDLFTGIFNDPQSLYKRFHFASKSFDGEISSYFTRTFKKSYQFHDEGSVLLYNASQFAIAQLLFNQILCDDSDKSYVDEHIISHVFKLKYAELNASTIYSNTSSLIESLITTVQELFRWMIQTKEFRAAYIERKSLNTLNSSAQPSGHPLFQLAWLPNEPDQEQVFRIISCKLLLLFFDHKNFNTISKTNLKAKRNPQGISFSFYDKYGNNVRTQNFIQVHGENANKSFFIRQTRLVKDILPTGII